MKTVVITAFAAVVSVFATPAAFAADSASANIEIRAYVPLVCNLSYSTGFVPARADGIVSLGSMYEFCNSGSGYRVVVDYAPGTLSGVQLFAGNDGVRLNGSGFAVLTDRNGADYRTRPLAVDMNGVRTAANLSLRIEAKV